MANTTDIMVVGFEDKSRIDILNKIVEIDLRLVSNEDLAGGPKVLTFKAYGTCEHCLGKERLELLIDTFKKIEWLCPDIVALFIADDNNEEYDGVYTIEN